MEQLERLFSNDQLAHIIDEAAVYMCACPAQLCQQILSLRDLYIYQASCQQDPQADRSVHIAIAQAVKDSHGRLEQCLTDILQLEGWDTQTLTMPAGLRRKRDAIMKNEA